MDGRRKTRSSSLKESKSSRCDIKTFTSSRRARRKVLDTIRKPHRRSATKEQKTFFRNFLKRLEKRDEFLVESEDLATLEEPGELRFNDAMGTAEEEWEVEEILDTSTFKNELYFLVLWKSHLLESCTWETEANLHNSKDAIEDFYAAFPKKSPSSRKSSEKK